MAQCCRRSTRHETWLRIVVLPRRMCRPQTSSTVFRFRAMRRTSSSSLPKRQSKRNRIYETQYGGATTPPVFSKSMQVVTEIDLAHRRIRHLVHGIAGGEGGREAARRANDVGRGAVPIQ